MRDKEVSVSETAQTFHWPQRCSLAERKKQDKKKKKTERKGKKIIKFSFVLPGVILFCGGIKWNEEVKKNKKKKERKEKNKKGKK